MFVFIRTIIYSSLFIGFMLIYLPARLAGLTQPSTLRVQQAVGIVIGIAGALVAFWCIYSFATLGKGTPAPFDPPRQLVTRGPYRMVRNPMYIAAGIALTGGAIYFESWLLIGYTCFLFLITHLLIFWYEEPRLKKTFGETYLSYCDRVGRWWPTI